MSNYFCKMPTTKQAAFAIDRNTELRVSNHSTEMKVTFPYPC